MEVVTPINDRVTLQVDDVLMIMSTKYLFQVVEPFTESINKDNSTVESPNKRRKMGSLSGGKSAKYKRRVSEKRTWAWTLVSL